MYVYTSKGFFSAAAFLLENKADPNQKDKDGLASIHWACHGEYVRDLNIVSKITIFINLCSNEMIVEYLIENCHGVDPNLGDKSGRTPLHHACR